MGEGGRHEGHRGWRWHRGLSGSASESAVECEACVTRTRGKEMSRLGRPEKDTLKPEDQAIWDCIAAPRSTTMGGPYGILMHTPALAKQVAEVEDYFRLNAALSAADRELVVLAAVREMGAR